ncbi:MAG: BatA domain-containing protein [Candidatus Binatus sp.]|uniref:BatA domain-containing protein n=1 Tax=Candidatus Binatus sp. TaxID=2811406 RepID=UPI00271AF2B1|nr:BatA domain-containing protein [Candidatus Binatus sp.]MDO8431306.1 BatA domain-containing protein [Candidatus Binatus sp.]
MGLLYPGALVFLALVPALILAYLAKERPSRVTVSSVLAFRALRGFRRERFGGWPRLDWMFFVEAFILMLAVLALAGPFVWHRSNPIAIVIDNSAAMQAMTPAGRTRFYIAREKLYQALAAEDGGGEISIYVTAPQPRRIAPAYKSLLEAKRALTRIKPVDSPNDQTTLASFLANLAAESHVSKVIFAGANALEAPVPPRIHAIAVGDAVANLAIGSFTLRREALGAEALHASLTAANFGPETRHLEIVLNGDGKEIARAKETLGARETGMLEFQSLPPARVYEAHLMPADALPLDNVAYAVGGSIKAVSILFISPTPADANGLNSIPGVAATARTPDAYIPDDLATVDLAIFEYATPKELPAVNAMIVMPPPGDPIFGLAVTPAAQVAIAGWGKTGPLTDSVNFRLLSLRGGEYFGAHPWMSGVIAGDGGALMLKGERGGHRFVATGFNPFPYLGKRNLPMSILTLNAIGYLAGLGGSSVENRTGQPWLVPAGVEQVILPSGKKVAAKPGTLFTEVSEQGVYEMIGPGAAKTPRAVNLDDLAVSDLASTPALKVESASASSSPAPVMEKSPLTGYVLAAIIALAALEAIVVYRRRRRMLEA